MTGTDVVILLLPVVGLLFCAALFVSVRPRTAPLASDAVGVVEDPVAHPAQQPAPQWKLDGKSLVDQTFEALFGTSPRASNGHFFKLAQLTVTEEVLAAPAVRAWHLPTNTDDDVAVGVLLAGSNQAGLQVRDVIRVRGRPELLLSTIEATARQDGGEVPIVLSEIPEQVGQVQLHQVTQALSGYDVISSKVSGSREPQAMAIASYVNAGRMTLLRGPWNRGFVEELDKYPVSVGDGQVDALTRALPILLTQVNPAPARNFVLDTHEDFLE